MGTRSTVKFYSEFDQEKVLVSVYQQHDGYIDGVGHELAEWLISKKMINGIQHQTMEEGYANGMGCLASQFIANFKTRIGSLYIGTIDGKESYNYHVRLIDGKLIIEVDDIFKGTPQELLDFNEQGEEDEE